MGLLTRANRPSIRADRHLGMPWVLAISLLLITTFTGFSAKAEQTLTVGYLGIGAHQRHAFNLLTQEFYLRYPDIQLKVIVLPDAAYKKALEQWFKDGDGPDVLSWQGGERLYQYVRQGHIMPLDAFWQNNDFDQIFAQNVTETITFAEHKYALPVSYYHWGVFYRRSTFDSLGLKPPKTWEEFVNTCETLKKAGIIPITLSSKNHWPAVSWFTYLALRLHGARFYHHMLQGYIPFTDERVKEIFQYLKVLVDNEYFATGHERIEWIEAMPALYRGLAGMTLIGSFFPGQLSQSLARDMSYFEFPEVVPGIPRYEHAPLDLFLIPSYTKKQKQAEIFLKFMSDVSIQEEYNRRLGLLPPNMKADVSNEYFARRGVETLSQAQGFVQYLDRDTPEEVSIKLMPIISSFFHDSDITRVTKELEKLRKTGIFAQ